MCLESGRMASCFRRPLLFLGSSWTLFVEAMLTVLPVDSKVKSVRPLCWKRLRVTGPL